MKDLPESYWHDSYRRLRLEEPSKTITGAARNEFVHPREDRCLTVRECAPCRRSWIVFDASGVLWSGCS